MGKPKVEEKEAGAVCYSCPVCGKFILSIKDCRQSGKKVNFCPDCGEWIDWGGIKLETFWPQ